MGCVPDELLEVWHHGEYPEGPPVRIAFEEVQERNVGGADEIVYPEPYGQVEDSFKEVPFGKEELCFQPLPF